MKKIKKILTTLNFLSRKFMKLKESEKFSGNELKGEVYNASYYGDPYAYDYEQTKFENLDWRNRGNGLG